MLKVVAAVVILALLVACGDKADIATAKVPSASADKLTTKPSPEAWKTAVESLYTALTHDNGQDDGVTTFMACFGGVVNNHCANNRASAAERDSFRKLRIFWSNWRGSLTGNKLGAYVSLRDNKSPSIVLVPHLFSANGWLYMNQVSVMVDGEVTIEQSFSTSDTKREIFPGGYEEEMHFVATTSQIEALRKITPKSKVLIRMTGNKAYRNLDKNGVDSFKDSVENLLFMYDTFQKAVAGKTIPDTPT